MEFRKIEYFLKATETLNFTEAAKQLYISPQALTQQIAALEQELGCKLFVRSTRKITLTEEGLYCYQKFAPLKAAYEKTVKDVENKIKRKENIIRVGFFNGLPKIEVVNPWLNLIEAFNPEMEVEVISSDLGTLWKYLEEDKLDICLTNVDSYSDIEKYDYKIIIDTPARIVVSMMHPWAVKDKVNAEDFFESEMLQFKSAYRHIDENNFYSQVRCKNIHRVGDFDTMLALLETGRYFAVFPNTFDYHNSAKYKYFDLPEDMKFSFWTVYATRKGIQKPLINQLVDYININYE